MRDGSFGAWLGHELRRREWSQADFARRLGVPSGMVSNWVSRGRVPSPAWCERIADVLGMRVEPWPEVAWLFAAPVAVPWCGP